MNAGKALLLLAFAFPAWADDRVDAIRAAMAELRGMDVAQAQAAVSRCYEKHSPYQTCVAQDFIVANVAARSARDPMGVLEQMADRITETMARNQVPLEEAQQFILLVKAHAFAQ